MNSRRHQLDEFVALINDRFGEVAIFGGNVWGLYDSGFHSITLYNTRLRSNGENRAVTVSATAAGRSVQRTTHVD
jgi:hypothetical protein